MLEMNLTVRRKDFSLNMACCLKEWNVGVFGDSGAGKTTLFRALAGLERGAEGRIVLNNRVLFDSNRRFALPAHKRRVGLVFQHSRLFPHYSVEGNLRYAERPGAIGFDEIVERLRLGHLLERREARLSGGEKRCVALGRTLLSAPDLLLLDEAFTGMDSRLKEDVLDLISDVQKRAGMRTLIISHDMTDILTLTDHVALIDKGRLVGAGEYFDILKRSEMRNAMPGSAVTNVLPLTVRWSDSEQAISYCTPNRSRHHKTTVSGGGRLPVFKTPLSRRPSGAKLRAVLRPDHIAIARRPMPQISIQNQLAARVLEVIHGKKYALCLVDAGIRLVIKVTECALTDLELKKGAPVWCLFKTEDLHIGKS